MKVWAMAAALVMGAALAGAAQADTSPSRKWQVVKEEGAPVARVNGRNRGVLRVMCGAEPNTFTLRVSSGKKLYAGEDPKREVFVSIDNNAPEPVRIWSYEGAKAELHKDWAVEEFIDLVSPAKKIIAVSVKRVSKDPLHFHFSPEGFTKAVADLRTQCDARR